MTGVGEPNAAADEAHCQKIDKALHVGNHLPILLATGHVLLAKRVAVSLRPGVNRSGVVMGREGSEVTFATHSYYVVRSPAWSTFERSVGFE